MNYMRIVALLILTSSALAETGVEVGDSYADVIRKMGEPKGEMKGGNTMKYVLYDSATIKMTHNKVSSVELKTKPAAPLTSVSLENDKGRMERLIYSIESRIEKQLRTYDELTAEEAVLRNRLRDLNPSINSSENTADYYQTKAVRAETWRKDSEAFWRRHCYHYHRNRPGRKDLERHYEDLEEKHRAKQIQLENEQYDIQQRLKSISVKKAKIEQATQPDLDSLKKMRSQL